MRWMLVGPRHGVAPQAPSDGNAESCHGMTISSIKEDFSPELSIILLVVIEE